MSDVRTIALTCDISEQLPQIGSSTDNEIRVVSVGTGLTITEPFAALDRSDYEFVRLWALPASVGF